MALPANDPYRLPNPTIAAVSFVGWTYDGRTYQLYLSGDNFCIFSLPYSLQDSDLARLDEDSVHQTLSVSAGGMIDKMHIFCENTLLHSGAQHYYIQNPLTYIRQTPADIILGVAHWYCDIPEADIELGDLTIPVSSFTATRAWCTGNSLLRSVSFFGEKVIAIIKELCEQSWNVFIYVNGAQQLACGYLENEPSDIPNWTIDENDFLRVIRYGEITDRKMPGVVKYGWDCRGVNTQDPKFGLWKLDTTSIFTNKDLTLESEYSAKWVDGGHDDSGGYTAWDDWVLLEIEIGGKGFCIDIDEVVQVNVGLLALGIDDAYPDNFRVHKVVLNPTAMTARLTLLKKKTWNL